MASTDYKKWYAKVKYYNGDVEDILIRKIKTQEGNQFSPKHYKDFNSNILYSVKTAMNDVEGKEQRYYAYIGKLAGSVTELNQDNKRIGWPAWPSDILDEPDNTSQDERQQNAFSSITAYREKAVKWLHNSQDYSECYDLIQLLLEKICNFGDRLSTSSMSSEIENKVHLGSGFYCTNAGFAAIKAAKNDCDWAAALLIGVFGENAKLMRIYPRKEGLKKFPLGFLMLAQSKYSIVMKEILSFSYYYLSLVFYFIDLFRERLKNDNYEGDIDQMIKLLPAYLSD
ncbi:uncharacterized protein [Linepithema humile]|uniref:uncharacterized protein isoform X1 n=1 Tax=Linepithema humile TaxID=83485 RepID=UPI00351E19E0